MPGGQTCPPNSMEAMDLTADPIHSPVELQVQRIRELVKSRRFEESLEAAEALAAELPENRDVLYLQAMSQRLLGQIPQALATLLRLEQHHPRFSRLYQERGHCHVALKDAPQAIDAFLRGVNLNPALPASWGLLEGLYRMSGQADHAATAAAHVATLKRLPPEVLTATGLFSDGDLSAAETMVRAYLLKHGNHVEAMRLLARIGIERDVLDDAELLLEAVLELEPNYHAARLDFARALMERHKYQRAREELETLLKLEPRNRHYKTLYTSTIVGLGEHEKAVTLYRELLEDAPQPADLHLSIAHSLKAIGKQQQCIEAYRAAAAARPSFGDAYWSLANLKTYRFTDLEITHMREEESAPGVAAPDRYHLCFALGKALEDRGQYAASWEYYERGNALKRAESRYRPEILETNTRKQIQVFTRAFLAQRESFGVADADPIFILGLPRAGSTLLEQILASHSLVEGTQELADIPRMVLALQDRVPDLDNPRYPGVLAEMKAQDFLELGEKYLADTRKVRFAKSDGTYEIGKGSLDSQAWFVTHRSKLRHV